ncbi:MAG TPA: aminopeptidase P family N-terminal domain-containing protein, partial [Terriglobales bacterium]|nr:aminopeptidase P family N-terminal domain-containing protein [Terriglobales bacterium]
MTSNRRQFLYGVTGAAALSVAARANSFGPVHRVRAVMALPPVGEHDRLPPDWYRRKVQQVQEKMKQRKLNALVLLNATNIIYTVGYFHISTERPLAALIPESGEPALFIPELESDQVKLWWVKDYESYFDFPGPVNRIRWIFERIARRGLGGGRIGVEECAPSRLQHMKQGAPTATIVEAGDIVDDMRQVKDDDELQIMRRAMYFADYRVKAGREFVQQNGSVTEDQILRATADAQADKLSQELRDVVGVGVDPPFGGLVPFGKRSAFPHAVPSKDKLKSGDALILSFGAQVGGYNVECERSF